MTSKHDQVSDLCIHMRWVSARLKTRAEQVAFNQLTRPVYDRLIDEGRFSHHTREHHLIAMGYRFAPGHAPVVEEGPQPMILENEP